MRSHRMHLMSGSTHRLVGWGMLALILAVAPASCLTRPAMAQELTAQEQIPLGGELAPAERVMTEESLRYAADMAEKRWQALQTDPAQASFDTYFEIFREVARIESLAHAMQLAGVDVRSRLPVVAAELRSQMDEKGLNARVVGMKAIETLVAQPDAPLDLNDPEALKVRYTLILDYISGIDVARLAVALAEKLDRSDRPDMALDIYADFLTLYFDGLKSADERTELLKLASANASKMADPAMFRILTDLLRMAPRAEKVLLAQVAFEQVDADVLRKLSDGTAAADSLLLPAWLNAVEFVQGSKVEAELAALREQARDSLETPAFEILVLAEKDDAVRSRIVSDAVIADVGQKRAIVGFDRMSNLGLSPEAAPQAYFALLQSFAGRGYSAYVRSLVSAISESIAAGRLQLDADQAMALLRDTEILGDRAFVLSLKAALPGFAGDVERSALRAEIGTVFDLPFDQSIGSRKIAVENGINQELLAAASLINGNLPDKAALEALAASENGDDAALLSAVAERLWLHGERRPLLVDFLKGDASVSLRQAVAIGVTGFLGFEAAEGAGADLAAAVREILPIVSQQARELLAASVGQVSDGSRLSGEALRRYVRYLASTGQPLAAMAGLSGSDAYGATISAAVFGNVDSATDEIKKIPDHSERLRQFRELAEARASVLDDKGWLNSAVKPAGSPLAELGAQSSSGISDGRVSVAATTQEAVPASVRPFMPNLLMGRSAVASRIPVPSPRETNEALADISKRGETRATRLIRFSSEHFDEIINLGVREYLYLNSETTVPRIIFVTRGVMTMSELIAQVRATAPDAITLKGGEVTLNVPLAVNDGATLIVSGEEITSLKFNTKAGAFLVNSGKLYFDAVNVSSYDEASGQPSFVQDHEKGIFFRPFILSWSGSETYAADSSFVALGYAGGRTYGMSLSSGSTDTVVRQVQASAPTGYFINNSFDNLYYGFYAFEAEDIVFVGNELVNGVIYGLDPHDRSKNLMMAYNTAYGTQKKHGIIISREVDDSFILGNLSFENHGTGIMLDRQSYGTVVYANDSSRNAGDGFSAMESPCALVENNMFYANGRSGVKIRNSWDVQVENNQILHNRSAGIEAYIDNLNLATLSEFRNFEEDPYFPIATVAARDNVIRKNRVGLLTRGASEARFFGNRFMDQLPRYVGGDLKPMALDVVSQNMQSGVVVRSVCMPAIPTHKECSLATTGVIRAQSHQPEFAAGQASTDFCVKAAGSPQAAAFDAPEGE